MSMIRKTTEQFIEEARKVHGYTYDYSNVDYRRYDAKVLIKCPKHGAFEQMAFNHLKGGGCYKCAGKNRTNEEVIMDFREVHGDTYNYDRMKYKRRSEKVIITCKVHGDFMQVPGVHLKGSGCPKCSYRRKTTNRVINEFKQIHGDKYDYSLVEYTKNNEKVKIICPNHGVFEQVPCSHLLGCGCFKCGTEIRSKFNKEHPTGWNITNWSNQAKKSKIFDSFKVYIIRCWKDNEEFYKAGRTFSSTHNRFKTKLLMPYDYEIIKEYIFDTAEEAFNKEKEIKRLNKKSKYLPLIRFNGMHECFSEFPILE